MIANNGGSEFLVLVAHHDAQLTTPKFFLSPLGDTTNELIQRGIRVEGAPRASGGLKVSAMSILDSPSIAENLSFLSAVANRRGNGSHEPTLYLAIAFDLQVCVVCFVLRCSRS